MNRIVKTTLKITATAVILLVLVVGGFVGYTWYVGEHSAENPQAFAQPGGEVVKPKIEPPKVDPNAKVGASVQTITSPVTPGSNSSIMIRTNPLATCVISVKYNEVASKDSGLIQKKADEFGIVEWTWTVEDSVPLGTWPVDITCANQKNSAMVRGDLKVVKTIE